MSGPVPPKGAYPVVYANYLSCEAAIKIEDHTPIVVMWFAADPKAINVGVPLAEVDELIEALREAKEVHEQP